MRYLYICIVALLVSLVPPFACASQEGVLRMSEFSISSDGVGSSGPVKVFGKQTSTGVSSINVEAFGRKFVAPARVIEQLQGYLANGALLSYEQGYPDLGGRTIYVSFLKGWTSGITGAKRVSVNENGQFEVIK